MFESWITYTVAFIFLQVAFLQLFKLATRKSKDIGALTVCVQVFAALFALTLSPFFDWTWPTDWLVWLLLGLAWICYAGADRLNATARKELEISVENLIHQVWRPFFFFTGIVFLGRTFTWLRLLGGVIIVLANMSLFFQKGKFRIGKYEIVKLIAMLCFTAAMTLDVHNSGYFNLGFYMFMSFFAPAVILFVIGQAKPNKVWQELKEGNTLAIIFCALCNGVGAVAILMAYQFEFFLAASISSVTVILNVFFAYVFLKERSNLARKLIAAAVILGGLVLVIWPI